MALLAAASISRRVVPLTAAYKTVVGAMSLIERTKHDQYPFIDPTKGLKDAAEGKTILVTGGSRGIGRAISKQFAVAGAARVIITGKSIEALRDAKSFLLGVMPDCDIVTVATDMTDDFAVQKLYDELEQVPDTIVNNVGAANSQDNIVDSDPKTWWRDWELNIKASYLSSRAYLRKLNGKPGVILNLSSSVSNTTSPKLSSYSSSKTAVNRLTEFIDLEHSDQGLQCIAFHPGGILDTGMGEQAPDYLKGNLIDTLELAGSTAVYLSTPRAKYLRGRFVYSNYDMERLEQHQSQIVEQDLLKQRIVLGDFLNDATMKLDSSK